MELFRAMNQWSTRPNDERFSTLRELYDAVRSYFKTAVETEVPANSLKAVADEGAVRVESPRGDRVDLTNWSFGQLCQRASAPASYLSTIRPGLAAECLNEGLRENGGTAQLLVHRTNGEDSPLILRAVTSDKYERIWNHEVVERLLDLPEGWRVPPARPATADAPGARPATEADVLEDSGGGGLSVKVGDIIAPAGLYASDRDMFAFLINERYRIADGTDEGLARGFFVWNSEVGDKSFGILSFLYRHVCGNHIVWGAENVKELRIRHVGDARSIAGRKMMGIVRRYAESSASDDEARIRSAKRFSLGTDKEKVLDTIFGKRILPRKTAAEAFEAAEQHERIDGDPTSAWGFVNGLTRLSQSAAFADKRVELDRAGGKVLALAS